MEDFSSLLKLPDILHYSLEERREIIKRYYRETELLFPRLSRYVEDVQHAKDIGLNSSVVSNLTYNLLLTLSRFTKKLNTYEYIRCRYILDDEYDKAYEIWKTFSDNANRIKECINTIDDIYFDDEINLQDFINEIIPPNLNNIDWEGMGIDPSSVVMESIDIDTRELILYLTMASSVGVGLLKCLRQNLNNTEGWLESLKNGLYLDLEGYEDYEYTYLINYNLYKKVYWPYEGANFRNSIEQLNFHRPVTPIFIEQQYKDEMKQFVTNPVGRLWRDYHTNKKNLYIEAKRIKLNENQWKFYFMNICRFEEFEKWIVELESYILAPKGFSKYVIKKEKTDEVISCIKKHIKIQNKPRLVMMPIRAAIDAGALERPVWNSFEEEFGKGFLKSKTSFSLYTDPTKNPYDSEAYKTLVEEFKQIINE